MLDSVLRPFVDPLLNTPGRILAKLGVSANMVTIAGFGVAVVAFILLAFEQYIAAAILIILNRLLDGLDGAVARMTKIKGLGGETRSGESDLGAFLDIVTDFVFYAGVPFFFALGRPEHALSAAFLIFSFMGTASSFLAYGAIAAKRGMETSARGLKGFYHMGGLMEGTETIAALLLICLFPGWFTWIAIVFGVLCWITTAGRTAEAWRSF